MPLSALAVVSLFLIPTGSEKALNDHINSIDQTQSIKFTYEAMEDNAIPFLDAHLMIKEDGTIGAKVYRKKTHTNQYLLFGSMHPLTHKLSVARTLLDRCQSIVTDPQDQIEEEENIRKALQSCGYPEWTLKRVKQQQEQKEANIKRKDTTKKNNKEKKKGQVVLPYIRGVSERISRTLNQHNISTSYRPHTTLRRLLVHPKDKIEKEKNLWSRLQS